MKKFLITLLLSLFLIPQAFASYFDVSDGSQYSEAITYLELQGAIDGGEQFKPDANITRAAAFKILFKLIGADTDSARSTSHFKDVPSDAWFAPYANLAFKYGLATGKEFYPEKNLRLVDALQILLNAYGANSALITDSERNDLFQDVSSRNPFYMPIRSAVDLGILSSNTNETLRPYLNMTRGEFADLIYKFEEWNNETLSNQSEEIFYKSDIFASIWEHIVSDFYLATNQHIDQEALFEAAVKGLLGSLGDPYTTYFSPDDAGYFISALSGDYEGIGAYLIQDESTGKTYFSGVVSGSPAEIAGIKAGDEIITVDGVSVSGMEIKSIASRISGAAGTIVKLTILRDGETKNFEIERAKFTIELEKGEVLKDKVWYIDIDAFAGSTFTGVSNITTELEAELPEPKAVIIDLRGNGGGYINSANFLSGLFVPQLTPLIQLDYGERVEVIYNGDTGPYQDIPVYIFVDHYTASASEIVSATLQENGATVIGTQTFGKGTAQNVVQYWDGSIFKFTIAHWLTGLGKSINHVGVTPDIVISDSRIEKAGEKSDQLWLDEFWEAL